MFSSRKNHIVFYTVNERNAFQSCLLMSATISAQPFWLKPFWLKPFRLKPFWLKVCWILAQSCWLKLFWLKHVGSKTLAQTIWVQTLLKTVAQTALAQLFRFKPSRLKQCWLKPFWLRLVRLLPPTILAQILCTWGAYVLLGGPHALACTTLSPPPTNMYDMYIRKCKQLSRFSIAPPCKSPGKSVCTLENSCNMHFIEFAHKGLQAWTSSAQIQMCWRN